MEINPVLHVCLPTNALSATDLTFLTAVNEPVYEQPWIDAQVVPGVQPVISGEGSGVGGEVLLEPPSSAIGASDEVRSTNEDSSGANVKVSESKKGLVCICLGLVV